MTPLTKLPEPVYPEPAHGRRKVRVKCMVPGCAAVVIEGHLTCADCFKLTPGKLTRENRDLWRQWKAAMSNDEAFMLAGALERNNLDIVNAVIERMASCP